MCGKPFAAVQGDQGRAGEGLDVVDDGRLVEVAVGDRERRADARPSRLAFQRLDQRGLFAADIGARAQMDLDVEIEALGAEDGATQQAGFAPSCQGLFQGSSR
jgi:hypothetical protein